MDQLSGDLGSGPADTVGNASSDFNNESDVNTSDIDITSGGADEGDMNNNRS
jgi:hypothetical protein